MTGVIADNPGRVLFVSNGHGEDDIACKILDRLREVAPRVAIEAWPMVGAGRAYAERGIALTGPSNTLPGEGFGTLSAALFLRDLRAGFVSTHWRQLRHARAMRGCYRLLVGVGDVVPLATAWLGRTPMAFVACAKSAYYGGIDGHTAGERYLMRHHCVAVFPRDRKTQAGFAARGIASRYLGNPMMDGLAPQHPARFAVPGALRIAMLPGSRRDATDNALFLLRAARLIAQRHRSVPLRLVFACHPAVDLARVAAEAGAAGWQPAVWDNPLPGPTLCLQDETGAKALLAGGALADMLNGATLAVGLAGTANEQALGLGLPLITLPGAGNQGASYVRMKMHYFGEAALAVPRHAGALADAVAELLADPARRARMAAAGRARMGAPGASLAIAEAIRDQLHALAAGGVDADAN